MGVFQIYSEMFSQLRRTINLELYFANRNLAGSLVGYPKLPRPKTFNNNGTRCVNQLVEIGHSRNVAREDLGPSSAEF